MKRTVRLSIVALAALLLVPVFESAAEATPPAAPTLQAPGNASSQAANPVFTWSKVTNATLYHFQVGTASNFASGVQYDVTTVNTNATPPTDLPQGTLYWRVQALNAASETSPWSAVFTFTKALANAPTVTGPTETNQGACAGVGPYPAACIAYPTQAVTFTWDPLPNTARYDVEVALDQAFTSPVVISPSYTPQTSYTITQPLTFGQDYYWRVRGVAYSGQTTQWSTPRRFATVWNSTPTLVNPPDGQLPPIENVNLQWNWLPGAAYYEVQIARDINFTNLTISTTSKGTSYAPFTNLPNTSYFWRVRGRTGAGAIGNWSTVRTFEKRWPGSPNPIPPAANSQITQLAPADGATVAIPTFKWTPFRQASYYVVELALTPKFEGGVVTSCVTNHTEVTPYSGCNLAIAAGFTYYWRVRAVDSPAGVLGLYTATNASGNYPSFVYDPANVFPKSPTSGASTNIPVLTWTTADNIGCYRVNMRQVATSTTFSVDTCMTTYVPSLSYDAATPANNVWEWWVNSQDNGGQLGTGWSRTFTLTAPGTGTSPDPLASPPAAPNPQPVLLWQPVTGATSYNVLYRLGAGSWQTMVSGQALPGYQHPSDNLPNGTYQWKVQANIPSAPVVEGSIGSFTVNRDMAPAVQTAPAHCGNPDTCSTLSDTPTFTWNPVLRAKYYLVTLAADTNFTNVIGTYVTQYNRLSPAESFPETQAGQATYWFVRPCTTNVCSPGPELYPPPGDPPSRPISAFRKESKRVTLLSPGPAVNGVTPSPGPNAGGLLTFSWQDYLDTNLPGAATVPTSACSPLQPEPPTFVCPKQEAASYVFQASQLSDFSSVFDQQTIDQTTYTPNTLTYPQGPIYWRVRAVDNNGNQLPWSWVGRVNKTDPAPTLNQPASNANLTRLPTFSWTAQDFAANYELEVYSNTGQPLNIVNRVLYSVISTSAWTPPSTLPPGTYGWRIRSIDVDGRPGQWTANDNAGLRKFTYTGPATTLLSPNDNAYLGDDSVLLTWQSVPGAAYFQLQTSTQSNFSSFTENLTTWMTAWAPSISYPTPGKYYWRVITYDGAGNQLGTSATRVFNKGTPPPEVPGPPLNVQASPADSRAVVTWTAPVSNGGSPITGYKVFTNGGGGPSCTTTGALTCTVNNLLNGSTYTFTVQATNAVGDGPPSAPSNAVTPLAVPGQPTNVVATATDGQATITWVAPASSGGSPITQYTVTSNPENKTCVWTTGPLTCIVAGLVNGTAYTFTVKAKNTLGDGPPSAPSNSVTPTSADWFHPIDPQRLIDSRPPYLVGPYNTPWGANVTRDVQVTGAAGVSVGADAVVLNVTVTNPSAASFLTIWPKGATKPLTSSLNWTQGKTIPNAVTVKLGTGGQISVFNPTGSVDVIIDVVGYYDTSTGDGLASLSPVRIQDSRPAYQVGPYSTPWAGNTTRDVQVTGVAGVPADAEAVVLNATATGTSSASFLTIFPAGQVQPQTSSLNWTANQTVANAVTVKLGAGGALSLFNPSGNVDVILDVVGYFSPNTGKLFHPLSPVRIQDSRAAYQVGPFNSPWGANVTRDITATNTAGVPSGADSVLMNVTVTNTTAASFLTVWPSGTTKPLASSINFVAFQTVANAVTVKAGNGGKVSIFNPSGNVDVIADVGGYYT